MTSGRLIGPEHPGTSRNIPEHPGASAQQERPASTPGQVDNSTDPEHPEVPAPQEGSAPAPGQVDDSIGPEHSEVPTRQEGPAPAPKADGRFYRSGTSRSVGTAGRIRAAERVRSGKKVRCEQHPKRSEAAHGYPSARSPKTRPFETPQSGGKAARQSPVSIDGTKKSPERPAGAHLLGDFGPQAAAGKESEFSSRNRNPGTAPPPA